MVLYFVTCLKCKNEWVEPKEGKTRCECGNTWVSWRLCRPVKGEDLGDFEHRIHSMLRVEKNANQEGRLDV